MVPLALTLCTLAVGKHMPWDEAESPENAENEHMAMPKQNLATRASRGKPSLLESIFGHAPRRKPSTEVPR